LREIFGRLDRKGAGVITLDDFSAACDAFGMIITPETKSRIFEEFDSGNCGFLTYSDFINHVALVPHDIVDIPHPHYPEARVSTPQVVDEVRDRIKEKIMCKRAGVEKLFLDFNKDKRKSISYGAFNRTVHQLGLKLSDASISALWKEWGGLQKGLLTLDDFVDKVLNFSLQSPSLSTTPITGYPVGSSMPDPVPKLVPAFDAGRSSIQPGEPHFSINSVRKPHVSVAPFSSGNTERSRPSTAPHQQPSSKGRSASRQMSARSGSGRRSATPMQHVNYSVPRAYTPALSHRSIAQTPTEGPIWEGSTRITA